MELPAQRAESAQHDWAGRQPGSLGAREGPALLVSGAMGKQRARSTGAAFSFSILFFFQKHGLRPPATTHGITVPRGGHCRADGDKGTGCWAMAVTLQCAWVC